MYLYVRSPLGVYRVSRTPRRRRNDFLRQLRPRVPQLLRRPQGNSQRTLGVQPLWEVCVVSRSGTCAGRCQRPLEDGVLETEGRERTRVSTNALSQLLEVVPKRRVLPGVSESLPCGRGPH